MTLATQHDQQHAVKGRSMAIAQCTPHNPGMDPAPGMLRVALPRAMKGCNNVLLIMPQWQLVRGNTGSVRLQQRVG
jgi:hypothetical protein